MTEAQVRARAVAIVDAAIADLARLRAELAGQAVDPVEDLRRRCRELGIQNAEAVSTIAEPAGTAIARPCRPFRRRPGSFIG